MTAMVLIEPDEVRSYIALGTFVIDNGDGTYDAVAVGNEFLIAGTLPDAMRFIRSNHPDIKVVRCYDRKASEWTSELGCDPNANAHDELLAVLCELVNSPNAKQNALWDSARAVIAKAAPQPASKGEPNAI